MDLVGKKVLVTGADGFIGSHLTEMLVPLAAAVKALSYYNSFNYWGWLEDLDCKDDIEVIAGDVRDPHFCRKLTEDVDVVYHLAALIAIPYSYIAPDSYVDTNINGTVNICQAVIENQCQRIIHTSTSEVYGTAQYVPIDEKHPLQAQSPYSASKIGAEAMAMSFYHAYKMPLTIARPFNTYGPRQSARAIIPTIITQIVSGNKAIKIGNLRPTRDLNYVEDTCRGLIALTECETAIGEIINIGSNSEISMKDLVNLIKKIMNSDIDVIEDEKRIRPEKSEVFRLWCNNEKIHKLTDYQPKYSVRQGLEKTIGWFSDPENIKRFKHNIYNV